MNEKLVEGNHSVITGKPVCKPHTCPEASGSNVLICPFSN